MAVMACYTCLSMCLCVCEVCVCNVMCACHAVESCDIRTIDQIREQSVLGCKHRLLAFYIGLDWRCRSYGYAVSECMCGVRLLHHDTTRLIYSTLSFGISDPPGVLASCPRSVRGSH